MMGVYFVIALSASLILFHQAQKPAGRIFMFNIDYILYVIALNFLCREIHFAGTNNAVVIIAAIVLIWVVYWRDRIWVKIKNAKIIQVALVGTAFTYFLSILIARRVFSIDHLALLPNEANVHVELEEVLENIAHLFLTSSAIVAFLFINKRDRKRGN